MSKRALTILGAIGLIGVIYSLASDVMSFRHLRQVGIIQQAKILNYYTSSSSHGSSLKALIEYHVSGSVYEIQ